MVIKRQSSQHTAFYLKIKCYDTRKPFVKKEMPT